MRKLLSISLLLFQAGRLWLTVNLTGSGISLEDEFLAMTVRNYLYLFNWVGKTQNNCWTNKEEEGSQTLAFISCYFLTVDVIWVAVSCPCHQDFSATMDCTLEEWAKVNPWSSCFCEGIFLTQQQDRH